MTSATPDVGAGPHLVVLCLEWPSPSRHTGGVGRYAYRLTRWLAPHLRISVVTGPDPEPLAGVAFYPLPRQAVQGQFRRYYVAPYAAARLVTRLKPDVVHSHGDDFPLAWRPGRPPIVRTFYGRSAAEARSGRWLRRVNHFILAGTEHGVRPRVARIIGIGPDSVTAFGAHALIPPVLPVDLPSRSYGRTPDPSVVFIGGYHGRKRGDLAIRVVEEVRGGVGPLRYTVFGPSGDRVRYPRWVDFHSGASDVEVRAALASAWALLVPSTYEGFGIPAWEAMGAGAVVVGTPNPGLSFLAGTRGAVLVDDSHLGEALEQVLIDADLRAETVGAGRRRAEAVAAMADPSQYLDFFRQVA